MQEPTSTGKQLAMAGFCLFIAALGVLFIVKVDFDRVGAVMAAVLGGFFVMVASIIYVSFQVRQHVRAPVPRSVVLDDEPALFLPRGKLSAVGNCLLTIALALLFGGWGLVAGLERGWLAGLLLSLPGIVYLMLPLFALTGR